MDQVYENSIGFYACRIWLYIRILITTNGEHYQVHTCNVERHKEWTHTSQVEDIIYHSGPVGSVRIEYEQDAYKNYLRGRRYLDIMDLDGPHMLQIDFDGPRCRS